MKKFIWVFALILICLAAVGVYYSKNGAVALQIEKVSKGDIEQYLEDTANVKSQNEQNVYIEGTGKINSIKYDVGDVVNQGDLMLTLDKGDLELQLRDANAKVDAARQQIKGTELQYYTDKIEVARSAVAQTTIQYESMKREYENAKELYTVGSLSKSDFDSAEGSFNAAKAALDSANAQLAEVKRGTPEYLKNTYLAQLEQALVNRDNILRNIDKQEVRSPITGVVLEKLVDENSYATAGLTAFVVGDVDNLKLEADILADDSYKVKLGDDAYISGKVLNNTVLKGKVVQIAPAAKTITSTLGVDQKRVTTTIELTEGQKLLKPGYTVDLKIVTEYKKQTVAVPDTAVFDYKGKTYVFVVENGKTVLRQVKKGLENDESIEVLEGLKEGDSILVKPDNTIKEGMKVKPVI